MADNKTKTAFHKKLPRNLSIEEIMQNQPDRPKVSPETLRRREALAKTTADSLAISAPGNAARGLRPSDEIDGFLILKCTDIVTYDRDPRQGINPNYTAIKESIRERSLQDTLTVTRRDAASPYMTYRGGNTRLKIVQELWEETQDPKYLHVKCVFKPWVSEVDTLSAHLIENEARGDTSFFDKAHGVWELKQLIEQERGTRLTLAQLGEETRRVGMQRSTSVLVEYLFAVKQLGRASPWLTKEDTNRIRTEHSALEKLGKAANLVPGQLDDALTAVYQGIDANDRALQVIERMHQAAGQQLGLPAQKVAALTTTGLRNTTDAELRKEVTGTPHQPTATPSITQPTTKSAAPEKARRRTRRTKAQTPTWAPLLDTFCAEHGISFDDLRAYLATSQTSPE